MVWFYALRLARIYPVHLAGLLTVLGMVVVSRRVGWQLTDAGYSPRDFVLNLFLVHTWVPHFRLNWNYPSWSISSEWFAYLWFPFAAGVAGRWRGGPAVGLAAAGLAGTLAVYLGWGDWPFWELAYVVPTFVPACGAAGPGVGPPAA